MTRKRITGLLAAILFSAIFCISAYAAEIGPGYTGWNQLPDGGWEYYESGNKIVNQTFAVDGKQYYFDTNGRLEEVKNQKPDVIVIDTPAPSTPKAEDSATQTTSAPAAEEPTNPNAAQPADATVAPSQYVSEEWKNRPNTTGKPDVLEVDIPKQHVWCYRNNVLVWDSYCTTGCVEKHTETPKGNFAIQAKQRQRYLMGPKDPVTGQPKWKNWVEYWMPFHNGCGFHDASWRKKFAGTIYVYAGSHGCVNLPPERVPDLYDRVYVGMPVVIHD